MPNAQLVKYQNLPNMLRFAMNQAKVKYTNSRQTWQHFSKRYTCNVIQ